MTPYTLSAALLAALLAACASTIPQEPPDVVGTVTRVEPGEGLGQRALGRILVEEDPGARSGSDKVWVTITRDTDLLRRDGAGVRPAVLSGVPVGARAEAWLTGPVLESYPAQGTGRVVVVTP